MLFEVETKASPEQVLRALTDFSSRRLDTWSRTLDPKRYELREEGETWAVAKEATPGSPFWVVAHYDWSDPAVVRMSVRESSYGGAGDGLVRITPRPGGGSHLAVEWENTGARRVRDKVLLTVLHKGPMGRMISRLWAASLDRYAEREAGS
ncbi:SRPBCC family protein [Nocardioides solisilvae]|uniref:SRPBCC family protein n=1 Tax=Nocardioides solisilvae TaxID=1542435 RepID=UPI000D7481BA|nr:SRPBCC family protein [Nocardioides solisilvae]